MTDPVKKDTLDDAGPAERPKSKGGRPRKAAPQVNKLRRVSRARPERFQRQATREESRTEQDRVDAPANRLYRKKRRAIDQFFIDKEIVPRGYTYEWKRASYAGKPDTPHMIDMRDDHWSPVPAGRHLDMVDKGTANNSPIERGGMILMERPAYLTQEARQEDYRNAMNLVSGQEKDIRRTPGADQFPREHHSLDGKVGINKTYEPIPIPD